MEQSFVASAGPSGSKKLSQQPCRICLQIGTLSIYDKTEFNMIKAIKCLTGLSILNNDPFTKFICIKCYTLLRGAVLFRRKARKSHRLLKDQLESKNNVNNSLDSFNERQANSVKKISNPAYSVNAPLLDTPVYNSDSETDIKSVKIKNEPITESQVKKVQCKECLQFVPKPYLSGHMAEHNGILRPDGKLECKLCGKVMLRKSFKIHIAAMHSESETPKYVCEHCGRVFMHQNSYYGHLITHQTEFPFKCDQCDYRGATESYLKYHMRSHTKDQYQCSECGKKFTNKGNLARHIQQHAGKTMKCSDCDKCFYTKPEVFRHHEVEHQGIKKYACNICNKLFGYRVSMMRHTLDVHKRTPLGHGRTPSYLLNELKEQI